MWVFNMQGLPGPILTALETAAASLMTGGAVLASPGGPLPPLVVPETTLVNDTVTFIQSQLSGFVLPDGFNAISVNARVSASPYTVTVNIVPVNIAI